ncbi:MAG: hypothetical protein V1837_07545 [Candidatus Woesearchaeota archaeon]
MLEPEVENAFIQKVGSKPSSICWLVTDLPKDALKCVIAEITGNFKKRDYEYVGPWFLAHVHDEELSTRMMFAVDGRSEIYVAAKGEHANKATRAIMYDIKEIIKKQISCMDNSPKSFIPFQPGSDVYRPERYD